MKIANINISNEYACKDAKNTITIITDRIMENLRFCENLKHNLKKNMNGMNFMNSSPISEKNNGTIVINETVWEF